MGKKKIKFYANKVSLSGSMLYYRKALTFSLKPMVILNTNWQGYLLNLEKYQTLNRIRQKQNW